MTTKFRPSQEWATIFGIKIHDIDGWDSLDHFMQPISLQQWYPRMCESTIQIMDLNRYTVLQEIFG